MEQSYAVVQVTEDENENGIELSLENDMSLKEETVSSKFPEYCALAYKSGNSNKWKALEKKNQKFLPPQGGWGATGYVCVRGRKNKYKLTNFVTGLTKKKVQEYLESYGIVEIQKFDNINKIAYVIVRFITDALLENMKTQQHPFTIEEVTQTDREKFTKRSGTTNMGHEFENMTMASLLLNLTVDGNVKDFRMSSNDEDFGSFDDIVVDIQLTNGDVLDDASGRYSTGWFWGNHYWTGSQSLCENIIPQHKYLTVNAENRTRTSREAEVARKTSSPSQAVGYVSGPLKFTSLPPFPVSFFMMRLSINSSFTTEQRILHVGLCMPYICTDSDIRTIMEETSRASTKVTVKVEAVRSHHNRFNIWQDKTFLILCGVTCLVVILLAVGTSYDFYLEHVEKKKKLLSLSEAHLKLDMAMPDTKTKNGMYVVNNNLNNTEETNLKLNVRKPRSLKFLTKYILKETILAFSLRTNIKTICDQSVSSDTIPVIHGLKSISMAWVILGHTCIIAFKYSDNMEYRRVVQKDFFFQTISNGAFSVDTFFFTSGLLVSFLYFRTNAKGRLDPLTGGQHGFIAGLAHFFGLILYRFARLTAPYLFTLGVVEVIMKWFNYNSVFEPPTMDHVNCPNYWWRNVLYINTLFPVEEMCMLWSWYLSDDTQFYIVGAVMLILAASHFKSGACLLLFFMASSWITTGYIAYSNSHMPGSDDPLALFDKIYDKPWTRLGPYLIGMCTGWFLFKKNCHLRMSKLAVISGWTAAIACLLSLVYGLYEVNLSPLTGAAYSALSHSAWALGLAWIVVACSTGHGGFANSILSATILYPFSRITYCAYLLHPVVIRVMTMNMDSPLHLGSLVMIIIFLGQVVASYALSFFVSLAFEAPVVGMLRILSKMAATKK